MSKHTPGPWELDLDYLHDDLHGHVPVSGENHLSLAQVVWVMENDERTPHCEANARLIAAAPDLLESLKTMVRAFHTYAPKTEGAEYNCVIDARAAIAKATEEA